MTIEQVGVPGWQTKGYLDKATGLYALALFVVLFAIYAALPSQQRNMDGPLGDIEAVTRGISDAGPRHFLYTYIGVPYYQGWQWLGYPGDAAYPLIALNAFCAALGVCGFYLFLRMMGLDLFWALILALIYAFSYGYWTFTTDAFYNIFAILPVIWSLPLLFKASRTERDALRNVVALALAILGVLAILATQEHLLFVPVVVLGLLTSQIPVTPKTRLIPAILYGLALVVLLLPLYTLRAFEVTNCTNAECVIGWLRPYGAMLPMYQTFGWDRLPAALWSFLATVVPLWRGLALRSLVHGVITPDKLFAQLALLAVLGMFIGTGMTLLWRRKRAWQYDRYFVVLCAAWFVIYIPPIIWLDPFGPERWIVPLMPALILVAVALKSLEYGDMPYRQILLRIFGVLTVALLAAANLAQEIWPNYSVPNQDIVAARVAAGQMTTEDVVISPRWDWTGYLALQDRRSISLLDLSLQIGGQPPDPQQLLSSLKREIQMVGAKGGRVFLVDVFSYSSSDWQWIEQNTGLRPEHFAAFSKLPAWRFDDQQVWEIAVPTDR